MKSWTRIAFACGYNRHQKLVESRDKTYNGKTTNVIGL